MATSWQQLTEILSNEHKEDLAKALLEALSLDQCFGINIEIRDHHLHAINIIKRMSVMKQTSNRSNSVL